MSATISGYLAALAAALPAHLPDRERILAEVGDHLGESRDRLSASMTHLAAAEEEAIRRFGDPDEPASLFTDLAGPEPGAAGIPRALNRVAAVGGVVAGLGLLALAGWWLIDADPVIGRLPRAIAAGAAAHVVIGLAIMQVTGLRGTSARRLLVAGLCGAVALLGVAGIAGTLELGRASGDYEWYGAGIGGLLARRRLGVRGTATAICRLRSRHAAAASGF
jgi:hypothetical protein